MKKTHTIIISIIVIAVIIGGGYMLLFSNENKSGNQPIDKTIQLPEPRLDSEISIEQALLQRRSIRSYKPETLTMNDVSQILWSAQGYHTSR